MTQTITYPRFTWKRKMMVQMSPRMRRWLPSTMSWEPMFSRWTLCSLRNWRALSTFSKQWIRILPFVGLGFKDQNKKNDFRRAFQRKMNDYKRVLSNTQNIKRNISWNRNVSYQSFTRQHFQQFNEHASIPQVQVEVRDATANPGQNWVDPFSEGLLLNRLSLVWWELRKNMSPINNAKSSEVQRSSAGAGRDLQSCTRAR